MAAKLIRLRYAGKCVRCGAALAQGTKAWWDSETRDVVCSGCDQANGAQQTEVAVHKAPLAAGEAGASARRKSEKLHARREAKIDAQWGKLSGIVKFISDDPQSTRAWAKGSVGEQRLAERLVRDLGDRAVLLHDRKVPGTRGNIDHLAVAASGVWVIDAKKYKGVVERRDVGGFFSSDYRLYVDKRDRTKLAQGLSWQIGAVREVLRPGGIPINAALCFVEAEWKFFSKPFLQGDVWVTWPRKLSEMIAEPGPITQEQVLEIAERLAGALPGA